MKGWPGYTDWINATSLLERKRFSEQLFRQGEFKVAQAITRISFDADQWLARYGMRADGVPSDEQKARLVPVVLGFPATQVIADGTVGVAYLRALTLDPAYQLK